MSSSLACGDADRASQLIRMEDDPLYSAADEAKNLKTELKKAQSHCSKLQHYIEQEHTTRRETDQTAVAMMKEIVERQKQSFQNEVSHLKAQLFEMKALAESLDLQRSCAVDRARNLESEIDDYKDELRQAENIVLSMKAKMDQLNQDLLKSHGSETSALKAAEQCKLKLEERVHELEAALASERKLYRDRDVKYQRHIQESQDVITRLTIEQETLATSESDLRNRVDELRQENNLHKAELSALKNQQQSSGGGFFDFKPCDRQQRRRSTREDLLAEQIRRLTQEIETLRMANKADGKEHYGSEIQKFCEEIGALKTTNEFLQAKLAETETKIQFLTNDLQTTTDKNIALDEQVVRLKKVIEDKETNVSDTIKMLIDEMAAVKLNKAELRTKCIVLERENKRLKEEHQAQADVAVRSAKEETSQAYAEIDILKGKISDVTGKLENVERSYQLVLTRCSELESADASKKQELLTLQKRHDDALDAKETRCKNVEAKIDALLQEKKVLQDTCSELDRQCEEILEKKNSYKTQILSLQERLSGLESQLRDNENSSQKYKIDYENAVAEKRRLGDKIKFLTAELESATTEYREQLDDLNRRVAVASGANQDYIEQLTKLGEGHGDLETRLRRTEVSLGEALRDKQLLQEELRAMTQKLEQMRLTKEKLKSGMEEAIEKIHSYKDEKEIAEKLYRTLKEKSEIEIRRRDETITQHIKLTTYLQSQIRAEKRMCWGSREKMPVGALSLEDLRQLLDLERTKNIELNCVNRQLQQQLVEKKARNASDERAALRAAVNAAESDYPLAATIGNAEYAEIDRSTKPKNGIASSESRGRNTPATVSGWVHVFRSDRPKVWQPAYGVLKNGRLSFYESKDRTSKIFEPTDLTTRPWKLQGQDGSDLKSSAAVTEEDTHFIVVVNLSEDRDSGAYRLYINTGSVQAREQWLMALQTETGVIR